MRIKRVRVMLGATYSKPNDDYRLSLWIGKRRITDVRWAVVSSAQGTCFPRLRRFLDRARRATRGTGK